MAFAYGAPSVNAARAANRCSPGAAAGVALAIGMDYADGQGALGAPVLPQVGTNGQLVDYISGATALGLSIAGAFGKGPLKTKPSVATALATFGGTAIDGGVVPRLAAPSIGSSAAAVAAVVKAKAAAAGRGGGGGGGGGGGKGAPAVPYSGSQRFASRLT